MSARRNLIVGKAVHGVVFGLILSAGFTALPPAVLADDAASQSDSSQPGFSGTVNANDVYVRSGPGDNFYATLKLDKGAPVTVVGLKNDWLKIVPPEGSFSYVAKVFVDKRGDGSVGRVTKPDLNVRAGSTLNAMKTTVQTKLQDGDDVQIVGEQDEYFKIKPPASAALYVSKEFVTPNPGSAMASAAPMTPAVPSASTANPSVITDKTKIESVEPISSAPVPVMTRTPDNVAAGQAAAAVAASAVSTSASAGGATTRPAVASVAPATQPALASATTQPSEPGILDQFDATEAAFLQASSEPLQDQPIGDLTRRYTAIDRSSDTPVTIKRIAEMRLGTLTARQDARTQYAETLKMQEAAKSKDLALKAEQQELAERAKAQDVTMYTAVGTLRASSLQPAGGTLYRLTDPGTGRTLLYIRSDDPKYANLMNQFIGVRGDVTEDSAMSLKVIAPTLAEAVDPAKVNHTVTAEVIPPTLMPHAVQGD